MEIGKRIRKNFSLVQGKGKSHSCLGCNSMINARKKWIILPLPFLRHRSIYWEEIYNVSILMLFLLALFSILSLYHQYGSEKLPAVLWSATGSRMLYYGDSYGRNTFRKMPCGRLNMIQTPFTDEHGY